MNFSDDSARRLGRAPVSTRLMLALMLTMAGTGIGCGDDEDDGEDVTDASVAADSGRDAKAPSDNEDEEDAEVEEDAETEDEVDAEVEEDSAVDETDAGLDADVTDDDAGDTDAGDAGADAGPEFEPLVNERLFTAGLSPARADRFNAVTFSRDSQKIYAAGFVTDIVSGTTPAVSDRKMAVAAFNLDGTPDYTFGGSNDGIARLNIIVAPSAIEETESISSLAVQSDGKIVVVGTFRKSTTARTYDYTPAGGGAVQQLNYTENDVDSVIARFTAAGALDTTFGTGDADGRDGVIIRALSAPGAIVNPPATGASPTVTQNNEDLAGVAIDSQDRIVLFAAARVTNRYDNDRVILRLAADGAPDATFGSAGSYAYDSNGSGNENAKVGAILAGDAILSPGYTNLGGFNNVIIARTDGAGQPVANWGNHNNGITINPFANTTTPAASGLVEAYSAAVQSTGHFVTTGYGRPESVPGGTNPTTSLLSLRFNANGQLDTEWGNRGGYTQVDTLNGGTNAAAGTEQGRFAVALPDDRIVMVGNGTPEINATNGSGADGIVAVLLPDGELDTGYNTYGTKSFQLGGANDGLWGAAVSPNGRNLAIVGYGITNGTGNTTSDNAVLLTYQIGD